MGRKSKQASSGHLPLTNYERKEYSKPYGTITQRLNGISQYTFGHCCLSLYPAREYPVASLSGYIYEKSTILQYILTKTKQCKENMKQYEQWVDQQIDQQNMQQSKKRQLQIQSFEQVQKQHSIVGMNDTNENDEHNKDTSTKKRQKLGTVTETSSSTAVGSKKDKTSSDDVNPLKQTSYWLAEFQPEYKEDSYAAAAAATSRGQDGEGGKQQEEMIASHRPKPPSRPSSPTSGRYPLRRKDLISLDLKFNTKDQPVCAISGKAIVHQQALALISSSSSANKRKGKKKSSKNNDDGGDDDDDDDDDEKKGPPPAPVVIEKVYESLVEAEKNDKDNRNSTRRICPVTGRKLKKILVLQKGGSSFAASGTDNEKSNDGADGNANNTVQAKIYRPTMT